MKYTTNLKAMKPDREFAKLEVERLKGMFLKIIIQELRSPISAIMGFSDLLKLDEAGDHKNMALDAVSNSSRISEELLDIALVVSEIDTEQLATDVRPYKVSDLFEYALKDNAEIISEKNLEVIMPLDREITEVVINPTLIKEVIRIFIQNAFWYSEAGGRIELDIDESIDRIVLSISDSGKGFDPESLANTSKFLKTKDITDRSKWPGLRVAVTKYIMDLHFSEIIVENNDHGGASVKLIFPVNNAQLEELHQSLSQLN